MNRDYCKWESRGKDWFFLSNCDKAQSFGNMFHLTGVKFNYCPFCGLKCKEVE